MGVALMAFSAFGLYAVTSRKPLQIYLFIAVLLAAVIGQIIFLINMLDLRSQFHRRMRQSLSTSLRTRYEFGADAHDTFTYIMNGVMLMGECCGINGPHDFTVRRNHYIHTTSGHVTHNATVVFPLACCHRSYIERGFHSTLDCALSWSKQAINTEGCYKTVYAYMSENFGSAIVWIYVVITYVELMQILLCLSQASEIAREKRANKLSSALRRARLRQRSNCMIVQNQLRLVHTDV
ncbi:hypothetical protein EGW08_012127 [Elysia chlorotica]|uniref:Tetraspanin n=1 Tax=Elysia chlorotica TaxID=188477 RepID=A0A433TEY3_ELYCH|nr:hypothetical protein EGW08_012127 [Elysia chlorotica]